MKKNNLNLKKIGEIIQNTALYGGLQKEEYLRILPDILQKNRGSLRVSAGMCTVLFLGLLMGSFFSVSLERAQILYGVMALGSGLICAMTFTEKANHRRVVWGLWYLLYLIIGSYAVVLNTLIRPELSAVTLCVFLTAGPLLIVDRPVRILGLQMLLCLEYALLARQMKHSYLAFADSVNMVCCVFLGFGVYIRLNHVSLRQALQAQHLRKERDTDKLTGLLNKAAIEEQIKAQLAQPHSHGALVIFDIDNFKHINDTYGHIFGDRVIHQVAACIRDTMPADSLCGRFGGDEFLILLPDIEEEELPGLLNALLRRGAESIMLPLSKDPFGMSIGAVFYPAGDKKFAGLLQMADAAMYEVKRAEKNGWKIANGI